MAKPLYNIIGIDHLRWDYIAGGGDKRDVRLRFSGIKGRSFSKGFDIAGLQMSDLHFTEQIYNQCDEVLIFDQNQNGNQLEFGRFIVQFIWHGKLVGEHIADSVISVESSK